MTLAHITVPRGGGRRAVPPQRHSQARAIRFRADPTASPIIATSMCSWSSGRTNGSGSSEARAARRSY